MTKISQLTSISNVSDDDLFVVSQQGTTYNTRADHIKSFVNGGLSGDLSVGTPNPNQYAVPYVQKNLAYGIPSAVEILPGNEGVGYTDGNFNNEIVACAHDALVYQPPTGELASTKHDASDYLARGLEVKLTTSGGSLSAVRITQPGQLYRIGDILEVTNLRGQTSPSSPGTEIIKGSGFVPARIRVVDIEPFMNPGNGSPAHANFGSCNGWIQTDPRFGDPLNDLENFDSNKGLNPLNATNYPVNLSEGEFPVMEADWASTIFKVWNNDTTSVESPDTSYGWNEATGASGWGNVALVASALAHAPCSTQGGSGVDWLIAEIPGTWLLGGVGFSIQGGWGSWPDFPSFNYTSSFEHFAFPGNRQTSDASYSSVLPGSRYVFNEWNKLSGSLHGGIPMKSHDIQYYHWTHSGGSGFGTYNLESGFNLQKSISMTKDDIFTEVRNVVEGGVNVGGVVKKGIWQPRLEKFPGTTDSHGKGFTHDSKKNIYCAGYTSWTVRVYHQVGFFLFDVKDILPEVSD